MINQKCQFKFGQKVHGLVIMNRFRTTCQKYLKGFLMHVQNGSFLTKIYFFLKKI